MSQAENSLVCKSMDYTLQERRLQWYRHVGKIITEGLPRRVLYAHAASEKIGGELTRFELKW
jgi:hypothetical protein